MFNVKSECFGTLLVLSYTIHKDATLFRVVDKLNESAIESISYYVERVLSDEFLVDEEDMEIYYTNIEFASAKLFTEYKKLFLLQNKTTQDKLNKITESLFTIKEVDHFYYKNFELKMNKYAGIKELKEFSNIVTQAHKEYRETQNKNKKQVLTNKA